MKRRQIITLLEAGKGSVFTVRLPGQSLLGDF